ncbi:hypothetical protein [endosymbiont GvMRE of Glomus versiforme]|uniref:hypothetical protein n=1 Tax=endosymbiont GvMRE of Glomus versiforme TaxID=2039283 RepID=UPI000EDCF23E|nr:hypothetical protein [endosymbiont GvMRE of Glomus versiforme]RHZ37740.1 hypothetical protein GvMRE_I1g223 [endosymbiont GvMRE of Glomus versiforme]
MKIEGRNFAKIRKYEDNTSILRFKHLSKEQRKDWEHKIKENEAQLRCAGGDCKKVLIIANTEKGWDLKDWIPYIGRTYVSAEKLCYSAEAMIEFYCPSCQKIET